MNTLEIDYKGKIKSWEDFEKAASVNSNTQLYKQSGNSIVEDVLKAIFAQMIWRRLPMKYMELITDAEINEVQETPELNSLIQYLQKVYYYAQSRDQYYEKTNYKWILGARIIYMLEWMSKSTLLLINRDQPSTLFGIVQRLGTFILGWVAGSRRIHAFWRYWNL